MTAIAAAVLLALTALPSGAQQDPVPRDELVELAREIVTSGYRHDEAALRTAMGRLDRTAGEAHVVAYWRGYAHWRLARIAAQGAGIEVQQHVVDAVAAFEEAVAYRNDFADGYAMLASVNDWQMMFHHDDKEPYATRTEQFLGKAEDLSPWNPRVVLAQGWDLFQTPELYGGSKSRALEKYREALELFTAEAGSETPSITPAWGIIDAYIAMGDAHLALDDLEEAQRAYRAASELDAECADARRGLASVARRPRLREGAILATEPIPAPIDGAGSGWPYWRGPSRTGASPNSNWSSTGSELWRVSTGLGYSGLAVADGRVFTKGYDVDSGKDVVYAFDARNGKELWRHDYPAAIWNEMHDGGTLSAPIVDGERVYVLNREGRLHGFAAADGQVLWQRDLVDEEALQVSRWGFAASPLVLGDQLILNVGRVLSLDKHTGKRLWRTRHYGDAYSTPTPFGQGGNPYLAAFIAEGLVIIDPRTGEQLASHEWKTQYDQNCASPLLVDDGIFISSGMNEGCALFSFEKGQLHPVWSSKAMRNTLSACVTLDGAIYGFDNRVLRCVTAAGVVRWQERGLGWGALSLAGDRLIVLTEDGELLIVRATPDRYVELHREKVFDDGKGWTTPVLVDGLLYLRNNQGELVCRDHRAQ